MILEGPLNVYESTEFDLDIRPGELWTVRNGGWDIPIKVKINALPLEYLFEKYRTRLGEIALKRPSEIDEASWRKVVKAGFFIINRFEDFCMSDKDLREALSEVPMTRASFQYNMHYPGLDASDGCCTMEKILDTITRSFLGEPFHKLISINASLEYNHAGTRKEVPPFPEFPGNTLVMNEFNP